VRAGQSGAGKSSLSPALLAAIDEAWRSIMGTATGIASYSDMRAAWHAEQL
jgi:hypothetical protein